MRARIYQIDLPGLLRPPLIYATGVDQAREAFMLWCAIHAPGLSKQSARIVEASRDWLDKQKDLVAAVERVREVSPTDTLLLFLDPVSGWFPLEPPEPALVEALAGSRLRLE